MCHHCFFLFCFSLFGHDMLGPFLINAEHCLSVWYLTKSFVYFSKGSITATRPIRIKSFWMYFGIGCLPCTVEQLSLLFFFICSFNWIFLIFLLVSSGVTKKSCGWVALISSQAASSTLLVCVSLLQWLFFLRIGRRRGASFRYLKTMRRARLVFLKISFHSHRSLPLPLEHKNNQERSINKHGAGWFCLVTRTHGRPRETIKEFDVIQRGLQNGETNNSRQIDKKKLCPTPKNLDICVRAAEKKKKKLYSIHQPTTNKEASNPEPSSLSEIKKSYVAAVLNSRHHACDSF